MAVEYGGLPFQEAISFFRGKVNVPTKRWTDLWQEQHDVAFAVAGVTKAELLADLRGAVDQAIAEGTSLGAFKAQFGEIAQRHGWVPKQDVAWRARTVYQTNLRTAYAAGRWEQMTHPDVVAERPFWQYVRSTAKNPRDAHAKWAGLVLPWNHPFWRTHFPPCEWGCKCSVHTLSHRDLAEMGKAGPDEAPTAKPYTWTDPNSGLRVTVPDEGIGPGWGYAPGRLRTERGDGPQAGARERLMPWVGAKTRSLPADLAAELWAEWKQDTPRLVDAVAIDFAHWLDQVMTPGHKSTGDRRMVGVLSPKAVAFIQAKLKESGKDAIISAAVEVRDKDIWHARRDSKVDGGRDLDPELARQLPRALATAKRVLWDKAASGLLFELDAAREDGRASKAFVLLNFSQARRGERLTINLLRSAGVVSPQALANKGAYELIEGAPMDAPNR